MQGFSVCRKSFSRQLAALLVALASVAAWAAQANGEPSSEPPQPLEPIRARSDSQRDRVRAAALVMEGRILQRRQQTAAALRKYQRAWRLDPDARTVLKQIVPLALQLGRVGEATRYAVLLADSDLEDPFLAERLAMLMADQLEYDKSLQLYQHVLRLRAEEPETRNPIAMHFEMGRLYFLTKKYQQASQSFRVVLDALDHPEQYQLPEVVREAILDRPELTYNLIAESLLEAGEYEEARELFRRAAKSKPSADWLPLQLARVDYRAGKYKDAQEKLETYVKRKLRFGGQTPYQLLQELIEKSNSTADDSAEKQTAMNRFRVWLAADPDNFPLLSFVADLTRRRGILIDAAALYEKSIAKQPTLEAYQGLISTYRQLGDGDKLLDTLGRVTSELNSLEPFAEDVKAIIRNRDLLRTLLRIGKEKLKSDVALGRGIGTACGLMALNARDYQAAEEFLKDVDTAQTDLYVAWGMELLMADEHERAANVLQMALDSSANVETRAEVLYYLAGALQLNGQTSAALASARKAAELNKNVPDFAVRPAWILFHAQRYTEAEKEYTAWLAEHAEDYSLPGIRNTVREARFIMSTICLEAHQFEEAIEWLELVLDEFPQDIAAMNDLGYLMVDQGISLERATRMIRQAVEAEPENAAYRDSLGWALYRMGVYDEAVVELEKATAGEGPDPIILDHLGDALRASGNEVAAANAWQRALQLPGTDDKLRHAIEQKLEDKRQE